jgi:hypothetical protein
MRKCLQVFIFFGILLTLHAVDCQSLDFDIIVQDHSHSAGRFLELVQYLYVLS